MKLATILLQFIAFFYYTVGPVFASSYPPQISEALDIQKNSGETLDISCTGESKINWTYPFFNKLLPIDGRVAITESMDSGQHRSRLQVSQLRYTDTGDYICFYANQSRNVNTSAGVYAFVQDDTHLFIPLSSQYFFAFRYENLTIPCRVTNPRINVTLSRRGSQPISLSQTLRYDPKTGFTIAPVTSYYRGQFDCKATLDNRTHTTSVNLNYQANEKPTPPLITSVHGNTQLYDYEGTINVRLNDSLILICEYRPEPLQAISLNWTGTQPSHRFNKTDAKRQRDGKVVTKLTISNIEFSDTGVYTCVVTTRPTMKNEAEIEVNVFDTEVVSLIATDSLVYVNLGASSIALSVYITAYTNPSLVWYQKNRAIAPGNDRFQISSRFDRTMLKILNPVVSDAGPYTLSASTRDMTVNETIILVVNEVPSISTHPKLVSSFYSPGVKVTLHCVATGFPVPVVTWSYQRCSSFGCQAAETGWEAVPSSNDNPKLYTSERIVESSLSVPSSEFGLYSCVAENSAGEKERIQTFYESDVNQGFDAVDLVQSVRGDNVTVECKANVWAYTQPQFYKLENNEKTQIVTGDGYILNQIRISNSTLTLVLTIAAIQNGGWYRCQTNDYIGEEFYEDIEVRVEAVQSPQFVKSLSGRVTIGPNRPLTLECLAVGAPPPFYNWLKDGSILNEGNSSFGFEFNSNRSRLDVRYPNESHSGSYSCEAINRGGAIYSNQTVIISPTCSINGTTAPLVPRKCSIDFAAYGYDDPVKQGYIKTSEGSHEYLMTGASRGVTTVEINPVTCKTRNRQTFDTWWSPYYVSVQLVETLKSAPVGTIIVGVTADSAENTGVFQSVVGPIFTRYNMNITGLQARDKFAFILQKGYPKNTVFARKARNLDFLRIIVELRAATEFFRIL